MIYLLRHGLDDEKYIGGFSDVSLIDIGIEQVKETSKFMKENEIIPKKIITSDIKRAVETAKIVSDSFSVPYELNSSLREQDKGLLNGMLKEKALEEYPKYMGKLTIDTIYPDGESLRNLYERIKENLEEILSYEDDTLLITHRGVINMLYYILNDIELDMNKERFDVTHASLHSLDKKMKLIRKVY